MTDETTVKRFADALHELETSGDTSTLVALFADGAELRRPESGKPGAASSDDASAYWDTYLAQFDEISTEFERLQEGDDLAWLEWRSRGTLATGRPIEYAGVSVLELEPEGQIMRFATYYDTAAFLAPETS